MLVGVAGQHRQMVRRLQVGVKMPDDQGVGGVGDRAAGEHHLPRPEAIRTNRQVLVEMNPPPDRAPYGGIVDEEGQRGVANGVTHPDPAPMRLAAEPLAEAKAG